LLTIRDARCSRAAAKAFQRRPRPSGDLAALHFGELADDGPVAAVEIGLHSLALCIQAEPTLALAAGGDPIIADEFPAVRCHRNLVTNTHFGDVNSARTGALWLGFDDIRGEIVRALFLAMMAVGLTGFVSMVAYVLARGP